MAATVSIRKIIDLGIDYTKIHIILQFNTYQVRRRLVRFQLFQKCIVQRKTRTLVNSNPITLTVNSIDGVAIDCHLLFTHLLLFFTGVTRRKSFATGFQVETHTVQKTLSRPIAKSCVFFAKDSWSFPRRKSICNGEQGPTHSRVLTVYFLALLYSRIPFSASKGYLYTVLKHFQSSNFFFLQNFTIELKKRVKTYAHFCLTRGGQKNAFKC